MAVSHNQGRTTGCYTGNPGLQARHIDHPDVVRFRNECAHRLAGVDYGQTQGQLACDRSNRTPDVARAEQKQLGAIVVQRLKMHLSNTGQVIWQFDDFRSAAGVSDIEQNRSPRVAADCLSGFTEPR